MKLRVQILILSALALAACNTKLNSANSQATVKPFYHSAEECPSKNDLPKIDYVRDLQRARGGKGVLLKLSNNTGSVLKILVDGKEHSETFEVAKRRDGTSDYETMIYRAGCRDKGIFARFFVGKRKGSWEIERGQNGYQFTDIYDGETIDSKFYKNEK